MSLNDDQLREIMVEDNAALYEDREDQNNDRQIQDGDQAVSCQAPFYHGRNNQAVTRDVSLSQEQLMLLIQIWQQRRVSKLVLIQKWVLKKLAMIKKKQSSMAYEDSVNKQRKEWSIEGTLQKNEEVNFIHVCYGSQVQQMHCCIHFRI